MGFTLIWCYKNTFIKNKKREAALKNEAGGDEKHLFSFTWPNRPLVGFCINIGIPFTARSALFSLSCRLPIGGFYVTS